MSDCSVYKEVLSLGAGRDLNGEETERLHTHLDLCERCRLQVNEFLTAINVGRNAFRVNYRLADPVRRRIIEKAAARASRRWPVLPRLLPAPILRPQLLVGAAAALALMFLFVSTRNLAPTAGKAPGGSEAVKIEVVSTAGGGVRLAWSDGEKGSYTVYKSTNPRKIGLGEAHHVRGNVWVDREADASPVVYYAIE